MTGDYVRELKRIPERQADKALRTRSFSGVSGGLAGAYPQEDEEPDA